MDSSQFDALVRSLFPVRSRRRDLVSAVAAFGVPLLAADVVDAKKKKKKKKRKKKPDPDDELPSCLVPCGIECCTEARPVCCQGTVSSVCYDPGTEECCPDLGGQIGGACPPGTRCEFVDDPHDTLGKYSFCCPDSHVTCGDGCCPPGTACCDVAPDIIYSGVCCSGGVCDPTGLNCEPNYPVDPRVE